jgi:hypothetical protein
LSQHQWPRGTAGAEHERLHDRHVTDGAALNDGTRSAIDRRQPRPSRTEEALMSLRKPLAALAAVTAALAVAVPMASASPATTAAVPATPSLLQSGSLPCLLLVQQIRFAVLVGNTAWANFLSNVFIYSGCGGAAI